MTNKEQATNKQQQSTTTRSTTLSHSNKKRVGPQKIKYTVIPLGDGLYYVPALGKKVILKSEHEAQYTALYRRAANAFLAKLLGRTNSAKRNFEATMFAVGKFTFDELSEPVKEIFRRKYKETLDLVEKLDADENTTTTKPGKGDDGDTVKV